MLATSAYAAYAAIVDAFPPTVEVTRRRDHLGDLIALRIVGDCKISVASEVARIGDLCMDRAWLRFVGPYQWGSQWIAHGELRGLARPQVTSSGSK